MSGVRNQRTSRMGPNVEPRNAFFESRTFQRDVSRERIRSAKSSLKPREPSGESMRFFTSALNSRSLFFPSSARSRATRRMSAMIFSTSGLGTDGAFWEAPDPAFWLAMEIAIVLLRARPRGGTLLGAEGSADSEALAPRQEPEGRISGITRPRAIWRRRVAVTRIRSLPRVRRPERQRTARAGARGQAPSGAGQQQAATGIDRLSACARAFRASLRSSRLPSLPTRRTRIRWPAS